MACFENIDVETASVSELAAALQHAREARDAAAGGASTEPLPLNGDPEPLTVLPEQFTRLQAIVVSLEQALRDRSVGEDNPSRD